MIVTLSELKPKELCITKSLVEEKTNKTITKQQNATRKIKTAQHELQQKAEKISGAPAY